MTMPTVPAHVLLLVAQAAAAKRAWAAQQTADPDAHAERHALADAYRAAEGRLTAAVVRWVDAEAAR